MRTLVVANGDSPSSALWAELRARTDFVVAADGGADGAMARGLAPDAVVGDLDSLSPAVRKRIPAGRLHHDPDPHRTDLQKAITFALDAGATQIDVIAAGGGRSDHALANLSVLTLFRGKVPIRIVDDRFTVSLVQGEVVIGGAAGTIVSLVAIGTCEGVRTKGLRWDLHGERLEFSPRGIHNEISWSHATVAVASGDLLLFLGRWVEKHG